MSEIEVKKVTNRAGTGSPNFPYGLKSGGTTVDVSGPTRTEGETQPETPAEGDTFYDTANDTYDVYIGEDWRRILGEGSGNPVAWYGDRGVYFAMAGSTPVNHMNYISIATPGNATDFADLYLAIRYGNSGVSDGTYGVIFGGLTTANLYGEDIQYFTVATQANTTNFGTLTVGRFDAGGCSDGTYGVCYAGNAAANDNYIDYVTIATPGNATTFGNSVTSDRGISGWSDETYGVFFGTQNDARIDYITIATPGNASDFGALTVNRYSSGAGGDTTRAVSGGGYNNYNTIDYVTIATPGNATDFGDLTVGRWALAGTSDTTYTVFAGGYSNYNVMDYITVQSTGNATDFGDLVNGGYALGGLSGASA